MKQNKFTRFLKTVPLKLWLLLAAIVAFSFISNDFGLVDIQKTAIVLAAGIDRNAEKGYTLTAQIGRRNDRGLRIRYLLQDGLGPEVRILQSDRDRR